MYTHLSLQSPDLQKSLRFYSTLLGVDPVKIKPDYIKFVHEGFRLNLAIELVTELPQGPSLVSHAGLMVGSTEAVFAFRNKMSLAGFDLSDERGVVCCYARQDKFWVTDPAGFQWEVYTLLEDTEEREQTPSVCCTV